jgi:CRISPR-associated protein Cas1
MKRMLNTLFITRDDVYLSKKGDAVIIKDEDEILMSVPVRTLQGIVCLGSVSISPFLMKLCADHDVHISFISHSGRYLARIEGPVSGNVLLLKAQVLASEDEDFCSNASRCITIGKIANCRNVLMRAAREHKQDDSKKAINLAVNNLSGILCKLGEPSSLNTVRGYEGEAAKVYFGVFNHLILAGEEEFTFNKRSRRPPLDRTNAMLSFVYTLLVHEVQSALESVGLHPNVGFLHRDRPGRPGLALDLMEEFRAYLADRLVLSMINRQQIRAADFIIKENGAVFMKDEARKLIIQAWQEKKRAEIVHPFLEEKMSVGQLPCIQALLFSRYIRGEIELYPPFITK